VNNSIASFICLDKMYSSGLTEVGNLGIWKVHLEHRLPKAIGLAFFPTQLNPQILVSLG
jgi:hypothetical protein